MLYCKKCKLSVTGAPRRCPLCQGDLTGVPEPDAAVFPTVPPAAHPHRRLIHLIQFVTAAVAVVCVTINLCLPSGGWWSLFVLAGIASLWLSFALLMKKRGNLPKTILWQVTLISVLAVVWDWFTGFHGWSIDYVIPILCTCAMAAMGTIARIRKLRIGDYIIYLVLDSFLGILPLVLILTGAVHVIYPSAICVGASLLSLSALFIFEGKAMRAELLRRLHL
ncbi:hypothetical protein H8711_02915 [Clostridiaceae bacterium NSJ-31]|uniref:Uncharacterized protein n=1 Tax=Ligaoa zhengdingensis TaxID=2763658 RepID=A0A926DXF8_9FIRM|nr:DUF6320 domain-containing protein [Ligaoa zhengdingensis]MBC8545891.1 hypothetical protein [Ligaoa zhengdingensis]